MSERGLRWIVRGRVQGVGFRHFTVQTARSLDVRGTVRNRPDGTVEVKATGPHDRLEALGERLRRGPSHARVEALETHELPGDETLPDRFEVRY